MADRYLHACYTYDCEALIDVLETNYIPTQYLDRALLLCFVKRKCNKKIIQKLIMCGANEFLAYDVMDKSTLNDDVVNKIYSRLILYKLWLVKKYLIENHNELFDSSPIMYMICSFVNKNKRSWFYTDRPKANGKELYNEIFKKYDLFANYNSKKHPKRKNTKILTGEIGKTILEKYGRHVVIRLFWYALFIVGKDYIINNVLSSISWIAITRDDIDAIFRYACYIRDHNALNILLKLGFMPNSNDIDHVTYLLSYNNSYINLNKNARKFIGHIDPYINWQSHKFILYGYESDSYRYNYDDTRYSYVKNIPINRTLSHIENEKIVNILLIMYLKEVLNRCLLSSNDITTITRHVAGFMRGFLYADNYAEIVEQRNCNKKMANSKSRSVVTTDSQNAFIVVSSGINLIRINDGMGGIYYNRVF